MLFHQPLTGAAQWYVPLLLFVGTLALTLVLRRILFRALTDWSKKTTTLADDYVLAAARYPSYLWIVILSLIAGLQAIDLPGDEVDSVVRRILAALLVLSVTMGVSRLLTALVEHRRLEGASEAAVASTGVLRTVVRGTVFVIGVLLILGTLGINIAPLLGALGVGGLAAGLALQPTLSNLFAGFQIAVARQVQIGHRVRLTSGEEGWVTDISWRTTTLRTPANHLILAPNSKFADSILTNFSLPEPISNFTVVIGVSYDADPRKVEMVLRDEAKHLVAELPELVRDFEPGVRLQAFGDSALQFSVVLRVHDYDAQFDIWNEIHQRFYARLQREGIEIPFPSRDLYLQGGFPPAQGTAAAQPSAAEDASKPPRPRPPRT